MAELMILVRENFSPPPAAAGGGSGEFWPMLAQIAGPAIANISSTLTQVFAMRATQPAPPNSSPAAGRPSHAAETAQAAPSAGSASLTSNQTGTESSIPYVEMLIELGRDALDAMERGIAGDDFAHSVCCRSRMGEPLYDMLHAMGTEQVLSMLANSGFSEQLTAKRAQVEVWLGAFMKYGDPQQQDDSSTTEKAA
jgi:hypothetical protein